MNKQNKLVQKEIDSMKTVKDNRAQKKWKKFKKTKTLIYIKGIFSVQFSYIYMWYLWETESFLDLSYLYVKIYTVYCRF